MSLLENPSIKFSILTPVYNVDKYIEDCILSALNQSYQNFELILVDDGSKDTSGAICDAYAQKDSRIRVYHKKNEGALATRCFARAHATGDYCVMLDADDYLSENALQTIYDTIAEHDCDCVVYGFHRICDGKVLRTVTEQEQLIFEEEDKRKLYRKLFYANEYNSLWRKAVKRTLFQWKDVSSFYHISLGEDLLQSLEIYQNSKKIVLIPDVLYFYRENPASATSTISYENFRVDYTVYEKVLAFFEREGVFMPEDFKAYQQYGLCLVSDDVLRISGFQTSFSNKKRLLRAVQNADFYKNFASRGKAGALKDRKSRLAMRLFQRERYLPLVLLSVCKRNLKKLFRR